MKTKIPVTSKPVRLVADHLKKDANVDFGLLFGSQKSGRQKAKSDKGASPLDFFLKRFSGQVLS